MRFIKPVYDIFSQLMRDEGWRTFPYDDKTGEPVKLASGGNVTIGYGFNISADGLPFMVAQVWLQDNIREIQKALPSWTKELDPARLGVLVNMAYNMGVPGLLGCRTFLTLVNQEKYAAAAQDMRDNILAYKQLPARYERLAQQMETGKWV